MSAVLTDSGCDVTALGRLLTRTASADLLVAHRGRRRLVEVKSASGHAAERFVDDARRHLDTWPQPRPDIEVEDPDGTARILVVPRDGVWVVTGTSLQNRDDMLSQLLVLMLAGGPVTLAIAAAAGWAVVVFAAGAAGFCGV